MKRLCRYCGADITHMRSQARYCSDSHRAMFWQEIHQETERKHKDRQDEDTSDQTTNKDEI